MRHEQKVDFYKAGEVVEFDDDVACVFRGYYFDLVTAYLRCGE